MEVRRLVIWEATHDNGWRTKVGRRSDGTFVAVTRDPGGRRVFEVAETLDAAHMAARQALTVGGHPECSIGCSEWAMRSRIAAAPNRSGQDAGVDSDQQPAPLVTTALRDRRTARQSTH
jgi:hypothetical protein